jgi:HK97 family phage major capsid protein
MTTAIDQNLASRRANLQGMVNTLRSKKTLTIFEQEHLNNWTAEIANIDQKIGDQTDGRYTYIFEKWLRHGGASLDREEQALMRRWEERATIGVEGTPTGGAYPGSTAGVVVPLAYADAIVAATKYAGPLLQLATVDVTPNGNVKNYGGINDTSETAALVTEGSAASVVDITANGAYLSGYKIHSNILKMSIEAATDVRVFPDLAGFLARTFGVRFGRYANVHGTTGAGSGADMTGFITSAGAATGTVAGANANDGTSNSHNSLGTADFETLQAALDYSYFLGAVWMVHPQTLAVLCGQLDKQGRLLFPGLQNDVQTINGKRVYANPSLGPLPAAGPNSPAVSTPTLVLGDFSKLVIRMSTPVFQRFDELYASTGQVGFMAFTRVDSQVIAGGGSPILYLETTY